MNEDKKGPGVTFPPPLVYVLWMVLGIFFLIYVSRIFKKSETSIEPWKPTKNIIPTGVYGWSRNPIYLGFNLFPIGMGIFFDILWVLLSFLPAAFSLYHIAIKKEEACLEAKFGDEYLNYKNKVRR